MATHSSILAWKIPWTEEPGRATVHGVAKSWTRLSDFTFLFFFLFNGLLSLLKVLPTVLTPLLFKKSITKDIKRIKFRNHLSQGSMSNCISNHKTLIPNV